MNLHYRVEDGRHCECLSEHGTRDEALAEIDRIVRLPWGEPPNRAPCANAAACARRYEIVEVDVGAVPPRELSRMFVVNRDARGALTAADTGPPNRRAYVLPALCGVVCYGVVVGPVALQDEARVWATWLVLTTASAAISGFAVPSLRWRAGFVVVATQPLLMLVLAIVSGEASHPQHSTGGLVAVFIVAVLMTVVSPLPNLAGVIGSALRRRAIERLRCEDAATAAPPAVRSSPPSSP